MKATANDNALMEKQQAEKSIPPKAKREIEEIIEQLRRTKKKPGDWTFIPRRMLLPVATHSTQFIRVYGENLSTAAQNDQRCRVLPPQVGRHPAGPLKGAMT